MENEIIEETTTDDFEDGFEDDFETSESEETGGLLARIVIAGAMGIIGVGAGYALSRKDDIVAAIAKKKEARRQKKVLELLDKLSKLQNEKPVEADETEE